MLSNKEQKERKSRIAAVAGTILFHALLLLALLLLALRTPLPLPGEEGVEVNLGYSDEGMGDIQPEVPAQAPKAAPQPRKTKADEDLVTDKTEEAPAITKDKKKTVKPVPVTKPTPVVETPKEPTVNKKALYPGKSTTASPGGNQGTTGKSGDQGNPNGTPGSPDYTGSGGKGNGISYDLGGRGARSLPKPTYNSPEQGKIVVSIKVDRAGRVTYASAGAKGTTISEINLRQQAENAARRTLFAPADADDPEEQRGTITYVFVKQK